MEPLLTTAPVEPATLEVLASSAIAPQSDFFPQTLPAPAKRGRKPGIQKGTIAASAGSKDLERQLLNSVQRVFVTFSKSYPTLSWRAGWSAKELEPLLACAVEPVDADEVAGDDGDAEGAREPIVGCRPDGGILLLQGVVIAAFEAKYQNKKGNAIERWFKNREIFSSLLGPFRPVYLTVVTGKGAAPSAVLSRTAQLAMKIEGRRFDKVYPEGPCIFRSVEAFCDERLDAIVHEAFTKALRTAAKHLKDSSPTPDFNLVG